MTVKDLAAKYNINPLYAKGLTGAGKTIGIATLATYDQADAYAYWAALGLAVDPTRITDVVVDAAPTARPAARRRRDHARRRAVRRPRPGRQDARVHRPERRQRLPRDVRHAIDEDQVDVLSASWGSPEIFYDGARR